MVSPKSYLIRAIYEWCIDEGLTPYIVVQVDIDGVNVPSDYISDNQIVFDIDQDACEFLELGAEWIAFNAEFDGELKQVVFPVQSVAGIYAQENNRGLFFEPNDDDRPKHAYGQEKSDTKNSAQDHDDDGFEVLN